MNSTIHYACWSHVGKRRRMNQDNFICNGIFMDKDKGLPAFPLTGSIPCNGKVLFGVFDGMGGEECGEAASLIAAEYAASSWNGKLTGDLLGFCREANERICRYAERNGISSMGTTAALMVFGNRSFSLCNIGDSKVFLFAAQRLEQLSEDHYAIAAYGQKPPLSQNLGIPASEMVIEPFVLKGQYNDGDIFLICSDGLTDMVSAEDIERILNDTSFDLAVNQLMDTALANGGKDNITIILCRLETKKTGLFQRRIPLSEEMRRRVSDGE